MHKDNSAGFTLVELMVVIAVVAILAVVAVPSYQRLMDNYRLRKAGEDVVSLLSHARSGAVKLHREVAVNVFDQTQLCAGAISAELPAAGTQAAGAKAADCTCGDATKCLVDTEQLAIPEGKHPGVSLASGSGTIRFNGVTGVSQDSSGVLAGAVTVKLDSPRKLFTATITVTPLGQSSMAISEN